MGRWQGLSVGFTAMASPCEILLDGQDEAALRAAAQEAIAEVRRIEHRYSRYRADSIVARINAAAGTGERVALDAEAVSLIRFCADLWQASDGLFDITSGVLRRAWDFRAARLPGPGEVEALLPLVGWQQVDWSGQPEDAWIALPRAGMEIDLGGIGKEYAADRAALRLQAHGVRHALVNLGGDLHALGPRGLPECAGAPWQIDIEHPRPEAGGLTVLARLPLSQGGLATSGDYERFFIHEGRRYCHVLDPRSGWPVRGWQSVSVIAANTTVAGALATVAMLKEGAAAPWLQAQQVRWLGVDAAGRPQQGGE
jgi:thiamine biosynthesis lipoprotein